MSEYEDTGTLERASDIENDSKGIVRRWILELNLADKREKDWRGKADKIWSRYRQNDVKKHSFNILWANTETLRPAVYNSLPQPDVRRRFKDADPLGKAVSETLKRSLEYGLDTSDFDASIKATVLDLLLPGRGVARVRYVPSFIQVGVTQATHDEENETHAEGEEALEGDAEELDWEQAPIEHVQWDDFRISTGKEWSEVTWIGFRHRLTRDELVEQFGEIGEQVNLDAAEDEDVQAEKDEKVANAFKTAEVWEIWCKEDREVLFICKGHKESPLQILDDPLNLQGFWPIPRPLYAIEDSSSLVPVPMYELYKEQAEELDRVSARINKLVEGLKLRGIYDATLSELSEVMRGQDNELVPAANVTALLERGGLEKAIWFMPIQTAALVLKELYVQREQTKAVIYELTGISDILRGSTNANETATAQQIKNQWGSNRLKRLQSEVSRFIRDLMRIQGEIIAEKFQPETFQGMTGLKYPSAQEKEQAMMQYQQQAAVAQQQGQQPPPPPDLPPSWDEIIAIMRDDAQRTFKVDIETDSTVAASIETDMKAMQEVLGGITQLVQGLGPAVQMGAIPVDALKEIVLTVARRAKLGNAVEDALDGIKQPPPQAQDNGEQAKMQAEQQKAQADMQMKQAEMQQSAQLEQMKMQAQQQAEAQKAQMTMQVEQMKAEQQASIEMQRLEFDKFKAQLEAETKVLVAQISAEAGAKQAQISAETSLAQSAMQGEKEGAEKEEK